MKKIRQKSNSIKTKLITVIMPIVIIMFVLMIILSYRMSSNIIESDASGLLESSASYQSNNIAAWLDENLASFSMAKRTIEHVKPDDQSLQTLLDGYSNYNSNYPNGIYIADLNGNVIKAADSAQSFHDVKNSVWYKEGLSRINMQYSRTYQDNDGNNIVSACSLLDLGDDDIRVISADVSLQRITVIVNSFVKMDNAKAFLVDTRDGSILAHQDPSLISTKISASNDDFMKAVAKRIEDEDYSAAEIENNLTCFKTVSSTEWILVSYVPDKIVYADVDTLRIRMVVIGVVALILLIVLIERTVHLMIRPVKALTETITKMAEGDFTVDVSSKGNDEIGRMGSSVRDFIASISGMIRDIRGISAQVSSQSGTTNDLSVEMHDAATLQSKSMQDLSDTVEQLSNSITEVADNAERLAIVVSGTKETSGKVEDCMRQTISVSDQGKQDMRQVNEAMEEIRKSISSLNEAIMKVGSASEEITNIASLIGNIADETNLLSLNASIEAARAGEAGKGFAVVALEIGKLAQTSTDSVEDIVQLVSEITKLVQETIHQSEASMASISASSEKIEVALKTFDEIFHDIHETGDLIEEMMEKVGQVDDVATNVAAIAEEQAASTAEIQMTAEDMVIQANSIADSSKTVMGDAKELSSSAENLTEQIEKFKVE
ncbi:MAG: methyl-accepting chemotaxis protein [Lachnospiraceae bacterium]|nr:methyl-accepting chemotaxis protein [Lachnospiraceae bacterium]